MVNKCKNVVYLQLITAK